MMNYQQKRHHELILANGLRGPAHEYKRLAEEARHTTVITRTLSQQVLGRDDGTLEEVSAFFVEQNQLILDAMRNGKQLSIGFKAELSGKTITHVIVDELQPTIEDAIAAGGGKYPARKKRRVR